MTELAIKLLLAHLLGDFVLQPDKWAAHKRKKKHRSPYLYLHILVHALLLLIILGPSTPYSMALWLIPLSHLVIDVLKLHLERRRYASLSFFADQAAHLLVIAGVVYHYFPYTLLPDSVVTTENLLLLTSLLFVSQGLAVVMRILMAKWDVTGESRDDSLMQAGRHIGMLERLFVFGFVVGGQWQAIGFLIAAKSVFRFGDLSKSKDRQLTEYILIGTLLSFGLAVSAALAYKYLVAKLP
ncbi:DUF3307 domain-containing protein [Roseivirga sp. BDSF3-8]|uniref:DUF3307 domain-containing protein n=1 Tax=Roseivirga sp. BDSF3-8 TaxID=3241598 RepID=UPI0035322326